MSVAPEKAAPNRDRKKSPRQRTRRTPKVSRTRRPEELSLDEWQRELRRQFGREQSFQLRNIGEHPVFSEFLVMNPQSKNTYRVAIRGTAPGENYCSCPDFATNALGTCKHVEFTLHRLERQKGGKKALAEGFQPPYSEVYVQYGPRREIRFRAGTTCPPELARLAATFFDDEGVLLPDAFRRFEEFLAGTAGLDHELRCYDDVLALIAELRDAEQRRAILAKEFPRGIRSAAFKNLLKVSLYDYQREGALFAARAGRCLIGDEMGLGKTIQALAAAEIMARHFGVERVLIICPASLKHQWEREIERFTERTATVIGGLLAERQAQFNAASFYKVMNYDTVHRDLDRIQQWSPDLVILDEAQRIKNWNTRAAQTVKKIRSPYAVVLTGTPLENRLEELVSIVQFIDQHRLGPTFRFLHDHQELDEHGKVVGYRDLDQIGKTLEPILIRRRKKDVLTQLPPRLDKNFFVPMTPEQMKHHDENRELVANVVRRWRRLGFLSEADQRRLMIALQNMRMSCDSTYLLDQTTDHGVKADELATLVDEFCEQPETKVVVFSQWVRMHELALRRLKGRDWNCVLFHGGVETSKRKDLVSRFREDPRCRAFLSTDAGGVGLNLQHANVVINLDLPWNPAVLEQRIGRVHRLGQTQPVSVVNLVAQGTIEEGMLSVLSFKKSLFAGALDGGEKDVFLGGSRLKRFMESVDNVTTRIPAAEVVEPSSASEPLEAEPDAVAASVATTPADPMAMLFQQGLTLLQGLATSLHQPAGNRNPNGRGQNALQVARDEHTGRSYVRFELPEPEVVENFVASLGRLLEAFRPPR